MKLNELNCSYLVAHYIYSIYNFISYSFISLHQNHIMAKYFLLFTIFQTKTFSENTRILRLLVSTSTYSMQAKAPEVVINHIFHWNT